jgi:hypothetical protein
MALTYSVNNTPATGAVAMYTLVALLITAGWTKVKDSDGTTYSSSGTQVTSGAAGANGLGNNSAWVNMKMPGSNKSYTIQRNAAGVNTTWRIVYSPSVGFTSGTPSATQVPSASDGIIMLGGGTDAAPSFNALYQTDGGYRLECAADNASPYGFWSIGFPTGSNIVNNVTHAFVLDAMRTGTGISTDTDLYVTITATSGSGGGTLGSNIISGMHCTNPVNSTALVSPTIVVQPANPSSGYIADPSTGKHVLRLIEYVCPTIIFKGVSTYLLADTFQGDITPAPLQLVSSNDTMVFGYVAVAWNGSAITI